MRNTLLKNVGKQTERMYLSFINEFSSHRSSNENDILVGRLTKVVVCEPPFNRFHPIHAQGQRLSFPICQLPRCQTLRQGAGPPPSRSYMSRSDLCTLGCI